MSIRTRLPKSRAREADEPRRYRLELTGRRRLLLAVVGILVVSFTVDALATSGRIRPGVTIGSLDLSGKTAEQAEELLGARAVQITDAPATFSAKGETLEVAPEDVGYLPDVDATVARASDIGREGNIFVRTWHRLRTYFGSTSIAWVRTIDDEATDALVAGWAERFDDPTSESGISWNGEGFEPVEGTAGRRLVPQRARRTLVRGIETWPRETHALPFRADRPKTDIGDARAAVAQAEAMMEAGPITLTAPDGEHELTPDVFAPMLEAVPTEEDDGWTLEVRFSPERLDESVGEEMKRFQVEAKDASFRAGGGSVSVIPSETGLGFDAEKTADALDEVAGDPPPRRAEIAFTETEPGLTTEEAEALKITERVSVFTTRHPCCQPRVDNIHRIAQIVDGAIIRPGAVFSLNQYVGPRTREKGFVDAPMIFDGEYKDDVGGGVSQFATTFYNAIFFGGYQFVADQTHSYYISRYPAGREATISWPHPDLKFRNNSSAGILVKTSFTSTSISVAFYGQKLYRSVESVSGERRNFTAPPEQREHNPALAPGQERVVQSGSQGFDITVTRVMTTHDGDTKRERIFTRYKPEPRIIEHNPEPEPTPTPEPTPGDPQQSPEPGRTPRPPETPGASSTPPPEDG